MSGLVAFIPTVSDAGATARKSSMGALHIGHVGFTDCHRPTHREWNRCRQGCSSVTSRLLRSDWQIAHCGLDDPATELLMSDTAELLMSVYMVDAVDMVDSETPTSDTVGIFYYFL